MDDDRIRDSEAGRKGHDLQMRAFEFAETAGEIADGVAKRSFSNGHIARQMFSAASSIGANLEEADGAQSRSYFISKCSIALDEAREVRYWLRMLGRRAPDVDLSWHLNEARELIAILTTIVKRSRENR